MARRFDEEEEYDYTRDDPGAYSPYYEEPAPEPPSYDPGADAAVEALTGGGDSMYDPGPGPALDALVGIGPPAYGAPIDIPGPDYGDDSRGIFRQPEDPPRRFGGGGDDTPGTLLPFPGQGAVIDRSGFGGGGDPLDFSFMNPPEEGQWHTMGGGAGRNDQYGLPEEYNILDPGALGAGNDPGQATHAPEPPPPPPGYRVNFGPQVEGPGTGSDAPTYVPENPLSGLPPLDRNGQPWTSRYPRNTNKLPDPNAPTQDPNAPRLGIPGDPKRSLSHAELWEQLFGVPYGQFPAGYENPIGLPGVMGTIGGSPTPGSTPGTAPGAAPGTAGAGRGAANQSTFEGFNLDKLNNPGGFTDANTAKYQFARVAQHYSPSDPQALEKIAAEMQKTNPNVKYVGQDKIDFGDGYGPIDVSRAWEPGKGGKAWVWIPPGQAGGAAGPGSAGFSGAAGAQGGMGAGGGFSGGGYAGNDAQGAFQSLKASVSPNAPKEQMEAAISAHFRNVPGFSQAYKESVMLNGTWYDMVIGYGGPGATWAGSLEPKH